MGDFLQFNFSVDLFVPLAELHFLNFATSSKDYSFNCAKDDFFLPRRMIFAKEDDLVSKVQTYPITLSFLAWQLLQDCSSATTNTTTM